MMKNPNPARKCTCGALVDVEEIVRQNLVLSGRIFIFLCPTCEEAREAMNNVADTSLLHASKIPGTMRVAWDVQERPGQYPIAKGRMIL